MNSTIVMMQTPLEWVPTIFGFCAMIGTLVLFVATKHAAASERQNITDQVKLYRKTQLENRLIEIFDRVVMTLNEVLPLLGKLQRTESSEFQRDLSRTLNRLARSLIKFSWRCGPFTDRVHQAGTNVINIVSQGAPKNETDNVHDYIKTLEEELKQKLRDILSNDLSELGSQP